MTWQDIVITIANIIFTVALIPQVYDGFKKKEGPIKFLTSVPISAGLYSISFAYWSLSLHFSAIIALFTGTMWLTLIVQRLTYNKK